MHDIKLYPSVSVMWVTFPLQNSRDNSRSTFQQISFLRVKVMISGRPESAGTSGFPVFWEFWKTRLSRRVEGVESRNFDHFCIKACVKNWRLA